MEGAVDCSKHLGFSDILRGYRKEHRLGMGIRDLEKIANLKTFT